MASRASDKKRSRTPRTESSSSLFSDRSGQSERSGRLSTQKHIQVLQLNPVGIRFQDLSTFDNQPPVLEALLDTIDVMMEGKGIVPPSLRRPLLDAAQSHKDLTWASRSNDYFADLRDSYGHTPSPDTALHVLAAARRMQCARTSRRQLEPRSAPASSGAGIPTAGPVAFQTACQLHGQVSPKLCL